MSRVTFIGVPDSSNNVTDLTDQQKLFDDKQKKLVRALFQKDNITTGDISQLSTNVQNQVRNFPDAIFNQIKFNKEIENRIKKVFTNLVVKTINAVNANPKNIDQLFSEMTDKIFNLFQTYTNALQSSMTLKIAIIDNATNIFLNKIPEMITQKTQEFSCQMIEVFSQFSDDERKNLYDDFFKTAKSLLAFYLKQNNSFHENTIDSKVLHYVAGAAHSFFEQAMEQEIKKMVDFLKNIDVTVEEAYEFLETIRGNIGYLSKVFRQFFLNDDNRVAHQQLLHSFEDTFRDHINKFIIAKKEQCLIALNRILRDLSNYTPSYISSDILSKKNAVRLTDQTLQETKRMKIIASILIGCAEQNNELPQLTPFTASKNQVLLTHWEEIKCLRGQLDSLTDPAVKSKPSEVTILRM